jgi:uncharacterized membrane protein
MKFEVNAILWTLACLYVLYAVLDAAFPSFFVFPFEPLFLLAFGFLHGWKRYGGKQLLIFLGIIFLVSSISENISLLTGVPFGRYYYSSFLGPRFFSLPILVSLSYLGFGYISWILATKIIGDVRRNLGRFNLFIVPLVASFVLTAWNFCFDPTLSTVRGWWVWEQGGDYFGVPLSNFLGWFLTAFVFFQLFALYIWNRKPKPNSKTVFSNNFYYAAVFAYAGSTLAFAAQYFLGANIQVVDTVGRSWQTSDIYAAALITSICTIFFIGLIAAIRINRSQER